MPLRNAPGVKNLSRPVLSLSVFLALLGFPAAMLAQSAYQAQIQAWREQREAKLKADDGWLTVTGLYWLKEGLNYFGTDPLLSIVLPAGRAPSKFGSLEFRNGSVTLRVADNVFLTSHGRPVRVLEMHADNTKAPDMVEIGDLTLTIIKRGGRYGLRVRDKMSRARRDFSGLNWFPVQESYRVTARFTPYEHPQEIWIVNVMGIVEKMRSPGVLSFNLNGQNHQLEPVLEDDGKLFIIFRDLTSGKTTYPAGRFLYADAPHDERVTLDFNEAINPPCAFTAYATCPLPPKQNRLPVAIEAGEQSYRAANVKEADGSSTQQN